MSKTKKGTVKKRGTWKMRFPSFFAVDRTIRGRTELHPERRLQDVFLFHKNRLFLPAGLFSSGRMNQGKNNPPALYQVLVNQVKV